MNKLFSIFAVLSLAFMFTGCGSVPMASSDEDALAKKFEVPSQDVSRIYVFRTDTFGTALKKALWLDGKFIGRLALKTFTYADTKPGKHIVSTESEFGNNHTKFETEGGKNYFVEQNIKLGVFVGGSKVTKVEDEYGKNAITKSCSLIDPNGEYVSDINPDDLERVKAKLSK